MWNFQSIFQDILISRLEFVNRKLNKKTVLHATDMKCFHYTVQRRHKFLKCYCILIDTKDFLSLNNKNEQNVYKTFTKRREYNVRILTVLPP